MKAIIEFDGDEYTLRVGGGSFRVSSEEMSLLSAAFFAAEKVPLKSTKFGPDMPMRVTVEFGTLEKAKV